MLRSTHANHAVVLKGLSSVKTSLHPAARFSWSHHPCQDEGR